MSQTPRSEITRLLLQLGDEGTSGEEGRERLLDLVYDELRRTARGLMGRERPGHTLQPTALVHEVYLRLVHQDRVQWTDRAHFLGIAARSMRQILVDHARARGAQKRGGGLAAVTLDEEIATDGGREFETLLLNDAMETLAELDPRAAQVVEMRLFGGMTVKEVAHALDVAPRTVDNDWASARLWLARELAE